jgi:hypothetical protein
VKNKYFILSPQQILHLYGPVGNIPLHDFFLLEMWKCMDITQILSLYASPEELSTPYINDLDKWRRS